MNTEIEKLGRLLATEIPLLAAMQIHISHYDGATLTLQAPLSANSNPHGTAFGGSIATLGIACGWAWTHLWLGNAQLPNKLVIQKHSVDYLKPVKADFLAICHAPSPEVLNDFENALRTHGKANIALDITTQSAEQLAARHQAIYAAVIRQ